MSDSQVEGDGSISVAKISIGRTVSVLYWLCVTTSHVLTMFPKATGGENVIFDIFFSATISTAYEF